MAIKQDLLNDLDELLQVGNGCSDSFDAGDWGNTTSSKPEKDLRAFTTMAFAAIERIAGRDSDFYRQLPQITTTPLRVAGMSGESIVSAVVGALAALRHAVDKGLLVSLASRLRSSIHDDFLQQAQSLLDAHYHVAAMVLIGGVMEDHLQKLCTTNSMNWSGKGNTAQYNDLLQKAGVFDKALWRRVQSIGDLRNDAAHGNGVKVNAPDVEDAHKFVSRLIADYPA